MSRTVTAIHQSRGSAIAVPYATPIEEIVTRKRNARRRRHGRAGCLRCPCWLASPEWAKPALATVALFRGEYNAEFGGLMAASTVMMLQVVILFFLTQRTFIQGITLTGIKG